MIHPQFGPFTNIFEPQNWVVVWDFHVSPLDFQSFWLPSSRWCFRGCKMISYVTYTKDMSPYIYIYQLPSLHFVTGHRPISLTLWSDGNRQAVVRPEEGGGSPPMFETQMMCEWIWIIFAVIISGNTWITWNLVTESAIMVWRVCAKQGVPCLRHCLYIELPKRLRWWKAKFYGITFRFVIPNRLWYDQITSTENQYINLLIHGI